MARDDVVVAANNRVRNASTMARHRAPCRGCRPPACTSLGRFGGGEQAALLAHLHRHCPGADAVENLPGETLRHHAARRRVEHQRRGVRGGQAVVEPGQAEIRDRRHVDQHFRQHHEQRPSAPEACPTGRAGLGPARACRPDRGSRLLSRPVSSSSRPSPQTPQHVQEASPTHDDVNLGVKKDTAARLPISL